MNDFINHHLKLLKNHNFSFPDLELRVLLKNSTINKKEIILSNFNINDINKKIFYDAFNRRIKKEPISKIFNNKSFWNLHFYVNKEVLDPRPETEFIIEGVEKYFKDKKQKLNFIDIGTGSGCLAISLAKEYFLSNIIATDISHEALKIAKKNSKKFQTEDRIKFINCDLYNGNEIFDIIVSNPPYLTSEEYNSLDLGIKYNEPKISLYGGYDGLEYYKKLGPIIQMISNKKSMSFIEIGYKQKDQVIKIFDRFGIKCVDIIIDYQKYDRILVFKKKNQYEYNRVNISDIENFTLLKFSKI